MSRIEHSPDGGGRRAGGAAAARATAGVPRGRGGAAPAPYQAVKEYVRRRIRRGQWRPGARIASEHALVAALGVSRMTVHRALREMAASGEVVRFVGVGTFVAEEKPQSALLRVASVAGDIRARGHAYSCRVVRSTVGPAPPEIAAALGIGAGDAAFHVVCVHRENGVPIQLEDRYVNPLAAPRFGAQDFTRTPPAEYLLRAVPLDEVEHVVDAAIPGRAEARLLGIGPSVPCLVLTRRTWSGSAVVTRVRLVHPGPRYRLGARFKARDAHAVA